MLYIMRHGLTEWNAKKKLQGQSDIPLNDEGRLMAKKAAKECENVHFDICFCSPLVRASETAAIVLENRNVPVEYDDRLKEMKFGVCEGLEDYLNHPEMGVKVFFDTPHKYTEAVSGGENIDELFARTGEFLQEKVYPLLDEGKDVLIVGHGAMNSSIICQVQNLPKSDFWKAGIENCKLKKIMSSHRPLL